MGQTLKKIFEGKEDHESMIHESTSATGSNQSGASDMAKEYVSLTHMLPSDHTIRLQPEREELFNPSNKQRAFSLSSSGITDKGLVRDHNEDSYALASFEDKSLFLVADGMGGHDSGEVASRTAADTVFRVIQEECELSGNSLSLVERAVRQANMDVRRHGMQMGSDMGTTLSIALVDGDTAYVANVGDSRVYWIENGAITQITTDHSLVAKMVATGKLTKEEARNHPQANLLYRAIGIEEAVKVDTFRIELKKGGTLLLCTDGLWGELTEEEIRSLCDDGKDVKDITSRLAQMANEHGGKDNITAIVVRVD
jgi:PPM family protein phosphatase